MNSKQEDLLQLALETPLSERVRTLDLNVGYDERENTWELIVKYHGDLAELREMQTSAGDGISVDELIAGYAILTVPESLVESVSAFEQIEYLEIPKNFYYRNIDPVTDSCIRELSGQGFDLSGQGVLIAILDSGIDIDSSEFTRPDGSLRIRCLWDQTKGGGAYFGDRSGRGEYTAEDLRTYRDDRSSETDRLSENERPGFDARGHGTAVAGIAAAVAPGADLLIVKLGLPGRNSFPRTTEIMRAVVWSLKKAEEWKMPLVINLSFGNTYGPHDGSALLERFLNNASGIGRTAICVGAGNEGTSAGHAGGRIGRIGEVTDIPFGIGAYETSLNLQLWKNFSDVYRLWLRAPSGREQEILPSAEGGKYTFRLEGVKVLLYYGMPTPYSAKQEIYFSFLQEGGGYLTSGIWSIRIQAVRLVSGEYDLYLPSGAVRNTGTGFLQPSTDSTLTIPSTAERVITVGAYDSRFQAYADFSGRGAWATGRMAAYAATIKPDLVAPGVNIPAPDNLASDIFELGILSPDNLASENLSSASVGGGRAVTGTSFSTPIVSGGAALMMEWGIVRGNAPFLYGEKLKSYLCFGARPLRGEESYPNNKVGWGSLCVADALRAGM